MIVFAGTRIHSEWLHLWIARCTSQTQNCILLNSRHATRQQVIVKNYWPPHSFENITGLTHISRFATSIRTFAEYPHQTYVTPPLACPFMSDVCSVRQAFCSPSPYSYSPEYKQYHIGSTDLPHQRAPSCGASTELRVDGDSVDVLKLIRYFKHAWYLVPNWITPASHDQPYLERNFATSVLDPVRMPHEYTGYAIVETQPQGTPLHHCWHMLTPVIEFDPMNWGSPQVHPRMEIFRELDKSSNVNPGRTPLIFPLGVGGFWI